MAFEWDFDLYERWGEYLVSVWGLDPRFARYVAAAQTWIQQTGGTAVTITSGYRSPRKQNELIRRWEAGDRDGLVTKPATRSWHMRGLAIDVRYRSKDFERFKTAMILWGCRWGGHFRKFDPVHFDFPIGEPMSAAQLIIAGH